MKPMRFCWSVITMTLMLAACASAPPSCPAGTRAMTRLELFFGRDVAGREAASDEDWRKFLDEEATPRFPDGFTVLDTYGQWRNRAGAIVKEPGKELIVIVVVGAADEAKIAAIRDAYKARFHQESVLYVRSPVCADF
jgi:hypothetical protein